MIIINNIFKCIIIIIFYFLGVKEFLLRNSMKSVEANNSAHSLVRCHRSYFINPHQVSVLSRSKDGFIFAELKLKSLGPIPVSKQYYDKLSDML